MIDEIKKNDIYDDIDFSDNDDEDSKFNVQIEVKFAIEDYSIELNDLNNIKFIDNERNELLLDSLISDIINIFIFFMSSKTYRKIFDSIK